MIQSILTIPLVLAATWVNLAPTNRLGGRMVSEGYLRGKTVLVDCRDYGKRECVEPAKALEEVWQSLKTKPFAVVGSHRGESDAERIGKIVGKLNLSYAVYDHADRQGENAIEMEEGRYYVFDVTGKFLYGGKDLQQARGVAASAIMGAAYPQNPKQWRHILDYETQWLPGKAYLHLTEFREKFPAEAAAYDEKWEAYSASDEIKRLAKLEKLARAAKDYDPKVAGAKKIAPAQIEKAIGKFEDLKQSEDPVVVQEAKNCLADLKWAAAAL